MSLARSPSRSCPGRTMKREGRWPRATSSLVKPLSAGLGRRTAAVGMRGLQGWGRRAPSRLDCRRGSCASRCMVTSQKRPRVLRERGRKGAMFAPSGDPRGPYPQEALKKSLRVTRCFLTTIRDFRGRRGHPPLTGRILCAVSGFLESEGSVHLRPRLATSKSTSGANFAALTAQTLRRTSEPLQGHEFRPAGGANFAPLFVSPFAFLSLCLGPESGSKGHHQTGRFGGRRGTRNDPRFVSCACGARPRLEQFFLQVRLVSSPDVLVPDPSKSASSDTPEGVDEHGEIPSWRSPAPFSSPA